MSSGRSGFAQGPTKCGTAFGGAVSEENGRLPAEIAKISPDRIAETLTDQERQALWRACTAFEVEISAGNGFDRAQVCSGGVDTEEVNPKTMESIRVPELYFAGEILDVDGACGGYNLQWAWSTGCLAGIYGGGGKI